MRKMSPTKTMTTARHWTVGVFITALLLTSGCQSSAVLVSTTPIPGPGPSNPIPTLSPLDPSRVEAGRGQYATACASCHGSNLEGEPNWKVANEDGSFRAPPHNETGHTWHHSDDYLIDSIRRGGSRLEGLPIGGTSNMPAYSDSLTSAEIANILAFIKSTWPDEIRTVQWEATWRERHQTDP